MKKLTLAGLVLFSLFNIAALFSSFNYIDAASFKEWLTSNKPVIIVDIQVAEEFAAHHFLDAIETNAFPVKTAAEKKSIDQAVALYKATGHDVVVVCPRGGGGAKRCYTYMKKQGVPENKLKILKGGMAKWPYPDMLAKR